MKTIIVLSLICANLILTLQRKQDWSNSKAVNGNIRPVSENPPEADNTAQSRIVGGRLAARNQFPYQAAVRLQTDQGQAFCGGSLISKRFILTAAHCAQDASNFTILLGTTDLKNEQEGEIELETDKKVVHPDYDSQRLANDIAILELPQEVELSDSIGLITLPARSQRGENLNGRNATVSGWGKVSDASTSVSQHLNYVTSDILANNICTLFYFGAITEQMVCLNGIRGKSSCNGDSGGPLVIEENDSRTQIGVVSFGSALGCQKRFPSVYTRVVEYLDFIAENSDAEIRE